MATKAYRAWLKYLQENEPEDVEDFNEYCLYVDMDRVFRYIFYDCHMDEVFCRFADQLIYQDEFFFLEGIEEKYWKNLNDLYLGGGK